MEFNSAFARGAGVTGMKEAILRTHATQDEAAFACMRFVDRFWSVSQVLIVASPLTIELDSLHTRRQQQTKRLFNQIVNKPEHTAYITVTHCRRTVCHWSSPICQQTAAHICKDLD